MPTRYALYFTPPPGPLQTLGAQWLGWDSELGKPAARPQWPQFPIEIDAVTSTPRKYGFHGTLKAPFHLAAGKSEADLIAAVEAFATHRETVEVPRMSVAVLGEFLALSPDGDTTELAALAASIVEEFDIFRAPLSETDLARRRAAGLSPRQDELLLKWGYPFVMDAFRFHMTLTGTVAPNVRETLLPALQSLFEPAIPEPFAIDAISLVREGEDGRFRLCRRIALGG